MKAIELFRHKFLRQGSYNNITELEWALLTDEMKQEFISYYIANKKLFQKFIGKELTEPIRSQYVRTMIAEGHWPEDLGLNYLDIPEDLLKTHIENVVGTYLVEDKLFDFFTPEQKEIHINSASKSNGFSLTDYQFGYFNSLQKLDYIVMSLRSGSNSITDNMFDWYKKWLSSLKRENIMDSILN